MTSPLTLRLRRVEPLGDTWHATVIVGIRHAAVVALSIAAITAALTGPSFVDLSSAAGWSGLVLFGLGLGAGIWLTITRPLGAVRALIVFVLTALGLALIVLHSAPDPTLPGMWWPAQS